MRPIACLAMILLAVPALSGVKSAASDVAPSSLYDQLSERVAAVYDSARGGFVDRKGIPSESAVELALRRSASDADSPWRARGLVTIAWTRTLLDTAGGGYHHSSASADPASADFEKRTDSNARRLENLVLAWRITGDEIQRREAARVADFLSRVTLDPRGGFALGQFGVGILAPDVNGIAAHAWLEWAAATREPRRRDEALKTLDRLWNETWLEGYGFLRPESGPAPAPLLLDQVEMGRALVLAASIAGRSVDRTRAVTIGEILLGHFADGQGGFRTKAVSRKNGSVAAARAFSAENARAARFLCELAALTGDGRYRTAAGRAWLRFADDNAKPSLAVADWALAVHAAVDADLTEAPRWEKVATNEAPATRTIRIGKFRR